MMKKILLLYAILCAPFSVYAADSTDGIVIGSTESLKEKNLPLDTDALIKALRQDNALCKENEAFVDAYSGIVSNHFLAGAINIPFSIQDLYLDCTEYYDALLYSDTVDETKKPRCQNYCSDFVFLYVQELVEKDGVFLKTLDYDAPIVVNKDGAISGIIRDNDGKALSGCNIILVSKEGSAIPYYINVSDNKGKFSAVINEIFNEVQQIRVYCPGYEPQTFSPGENMEIVIKPHELPPVIITATLCDDATLQRLHATNGETVRDAERAFCVPIECITGYVLINAYTSEAECIKM